MGELPLERSQDIIPGVTPCKVSVLIQTEMKTTQSRELSPHNAELLKAAPSQQGGQESWNDKQGPALATGGPSAV